MKKILSYSFVIFLSLIFFSCSSKNDQQTKIRIVDLSGKAHPVITKMPELNAQALAAQGKQQAAQNNFSNDIKEEKPQQNLAQNIAPNNSNFGDMMQKTLQPAQPPIAPQKAVEQNQKTEPSESIVSAGTVEERDQNVEYDLSESTPAEAKKSEISKAVKSKTKKEVLVEKPAKKSANNAAVVKGFFAQVGSFSSISNAKQALVKMQKFHKGKIETVEGEKTIHRVLIGPFVSREAANEMVKKINDSGHEAILVRKK